MSICLHSDDSWWLLKSLMVMKKSHVATIDQFFFHGWVVANMVYLDRNNDNERESKESLHVFKLNGEGIKLKK
jgi:hypothetical protein